MFAFVFYHSIPIFVFPTIIPKTILLA